LHALSACNARFNRRNSLLTELSLGGPAEIAGEGSPNIEEEKEEEAVEEDSGENTAGDGAPDPSLSPCAPKLLEASPAPPGWLR
jgi:hypothetical protein